MFKVIKTRIEYDAVLSEIEKYIDLDPKENSPEAEKLELLTLIIQDYESKKFEFNLPDPIEAIKFRMDQLGFTQRNLIPYIGSKSKVSEVLSKKRPLTLSMIRSLYTNLGIPANVLLQEQNISSFIDYDIDWKRFPLREMITRGWIKGNIEDINNRAEKMVRQFFEPVGSLNEAIALYRKTKNVRSARKMDNYALTAWTARIITKSLEQPVLVEYKDGTVNLDFMKNVAQLSWSDHGPLLAREFLYKNGIQLIIEPHLPKTYLDGAVVIERKNNPLIGLTVRYDRIDNFWFSLMHELAHLCLHYENEIIQFYDDLDFDDSENEIENEADKLAAEALIPNEVWNKSPASRLKSPEAAENLANKLGIHPAIVAGRMRREFKAYRLLNNLIGHKKVRILFQELNWDTK